MKNPQRTVLTRIIATLCLAALAVGLLLAVTPKQNAAELNVPLGSGNLPDPLATVVPSTYPPLETPIQLPVLATPTLVALQPAALVTATLTSNIAPASSAALTQKTTLDNSEGITAVTWAPTGDKLLFVTASGKLYWTNYAVNNPTLIHDYGPTFHGPLDQAPMTNTLFVPGLAIHFTVGQDPVLQEAPATYFRQLRWWSSARVSGVAGGPLGGGYVGGEKLITLDTNGAFVEERNIPYMWTGVVRPGGVWLAYSTDQRVTSTPFYGSDPETVYLLNLNDGQRLQITKAGKGFGMHSWSPDGRWFLMSTYVNDDIQDVLVSADGREWVVLGNIGSDVAWSPDSKHLAYSIVHGGCDTQDTPPCPSASEVYIIDVLARKSSPISAPGVSLNLTAPMVKPSWSPNGAILTLLSLDRIAPGTHSTTSPAIYHLVAP